MSPMTLILPISQHLQQITLFVIGAAGSLRAIPIVVAS
jgi:hypothetical protein